MTNQKPIHPKKKFFGKKRPYHGRRTGGFKKQDRNEKPASAVDFPEGLVLYCRNRKEILDVQPKSFDFALLLKEYAQKTETVEMEFDIVYGTERSIKQYYKIADDKFDSERVEKEKKAAQADKL